MGYAVLWHQQAWPVEVIALPESTTPTIGLPDLHGPVSGLVDRHIVELDHLCDALLGKWSQSDENVIRRESVLEIVEGLLLVVHLVDLLHACHLVFLFPTRDLFIRVCLAVPHTT